MQLENALAQISEIRSRMAATETFYGYRSATVATTAVLGLSAAAIQAVWIPQPADSIQQYLLLWIGIAVIGAAVNGVEMIVRCRRATSALSVQMTRLAALQFLPSIVAGALLTYVLVLFAVECTWMLPGLWAIVFGLGIFASSRLLPKPVILVASYYLASGIVCLALAQGTAALSPWSMIGTFVVGQSLLALVLYLTLERNRGKKEPQ